MGVPTRRDCIAGSYPPVRHAKIGNRNFRNSDSDFRNRNSIQNRQNRRTRRFFTDSTTLYQVLTTNQNRRTPILTTAHKNRRRNPMISKPESAMRLIYPLLRGEGQGEGQTSTLLLSPLPRAAQTKSLPVIVRDKSVSSLPSRTFVRKAFPQNRHIRRFSTYSTTLYQVLTTNQNHRTPICRHSRFGILSSFDISHSLPI